MYEFEVFGKSIWLIFVSAATNVAIHFLQTNNVRRFGRNDTQNTFESIETVTPANPFMDIVAQ